MRGGPPAGKLGEVPATPPSLMLRNIHMQDDGT